MYLNVFRLIYNVFDRLFGCHECIVPLTPWCAGLFEFLVENSKPPSKVRAQDMRHILLVLPFLLHDLVREEVENFNSKHQECQPLVNPSSELIDVTLLLLTWYRLFRRSEPAKDDEDLLELKELRDRYLNPPEHIKYRLK